MEYNSVPTAKQNPGVTLLEETLKTLNEWSPDAQNQFVFNLVMEINSRRRAEIRDMNDRASSLELSLLPDFQPPISQTKINRF